MPVERVVTRRPSWKRIAQEKAHEAHMRHREAVALRRKLQRIPRLVRWMFGVGG
jgi:hypothetical protein